MSISEALLPHDEKVICTLRHGKIDIFAKTIDKIKNSDYINIQNGVIHQLNKDIHSIIKINLKNIFEKKSEPEKYKKINMCFKLNDDIVTSLKSVGGNEATVIIEDTKKYKVYGNTIFDLPKHTLSHKCSPLPIIKDKMLIGKERKLDNSKIIKQLNNKQKIKKGKKKQQTSVNLLIFKDQFSGIDIPNKEVFLFNKEAVGEYRGKVPQEILKSYSFMKIPGEEIIFKLAKINGQYWFKTKVKIDEDIFIELF
jgi:hypothetical protein